MFRQWNRTKWDQFRLDVLRLRVSSFSKTLISGPQISCQSSAVDGHRTGEKSSPQQINNMSIKHMLTTSTQEVTHSRADACVITHAPAEAGGCIMHVVAFSPFD